VVKLKASPVAEEALTRIGALYDIEDRIRGMTADERRELRRQYARPVFDDLKAWITDTLPTVPQKQKLAEAMRYALSRWEALGVYIDDGRVEIDNNIAERAIRPIGIGRNYPHLRVMRSSPRRVPMNAVQHLMFGVDELRIISIRGSGGTASVDPAGGSARPWFQAVATAQARAPSSTGPLRDTYALSSCSRGRAIGRSR